MAPINKTGHFQTEFVGMGVEVMKDENRFPRQVGVLQFWRRCKNSCSKSEGRVLAMP